MPEATTAAPAAAPVTPAPVSEYTSDKRHMGVSDDAFLEGLDGVAFDLSENEQEQPENDNEARAAPKSKPKPKAKPSKAKEPDPVEDEAADESPEAAEEPEEAEPEIEAAAEEEEPLLPRGKGTREEPLTIKDLPDDKLFLELKVDGEKVVVSMREAVEGAYLRPQAFDRMLSKANHAKEEAEQIATAAVTHQENFRAGFNKFITNPESLFTMMLAKHENVLHEVAVRYAEMRAREQQDPTLQHKRRTEQERREIEQERQRTAAERQQWETTRRSTEAAESALRELKPGYEAGLKAAGFPTVTPELKQEIRVRLGVVRGAKGRISADDVKEAVVRAARFLAAGGTPSPAAPQPERPAKARPAPSPMAAPRAPARPNGRKDFSAMSQNRRLQDPDWYWEQ